MPASIPRAASVFFAGAITCFFGLKSLPLDHLNNVDAVQHVYTYAIVPPTDDISTTHVSAWRPNHGASIDTTTVKMMPTYGVLYLGCNLEKASGIIFARDMANNRRLDEIVNPFKPVKIPMVSAVTRMTSPMLPSSP